MLNAWPFTFCVQAKMTPKLSDHVAEAALFLASDGAAGIAGQELVVDAAAQSS